MTALTEGILIAVQVDYRGSSVEKFFLSGRVPHAILFCGENGVKNRALADFSAKAWLCGFVPCERCDVCYKANKKQHPDIVYVKDTFENGQYKIEGLRNEIRKGALFPNEGKYRVYVFEDVDTMSEICQNAMLKFIEEPADFNRFIFTAVSDRNILPTICSRVTSVAVSGEGDNLDDEAFELAKRAATALRQKDEYAFAAALSGAKTRDTMLSTLKALHKLLRDIVFSHETKEIIKFVQITEKLEEFMTLQKFNPNLNLAAAAYTAEIFDIL
ncbi:MAG: hypothetical protein FWH05_04990 [Oscillospiraceae bacterium]|nr:hypothetical protein [Oscillospiraceae bacterium]